MREAKHEKTTALLKTFLDFLSDTFPTSKSKRSSILCHFVDDTSDRIQLRGSHSVDLENDPFHYPGDLSTTVRDGSPGIP